MSKNSDMKSMLKDALILFVITLIAGVTLGFVYELTKEPIRLQQEKAIQDACREVFAEYADTELQFVEENYAPDAGKQAELAEIGVKIGTVYAAMSQNGTLCGYVVESTTTEGYGGNIVLYVGVTTQGAVSGVSILEISETPGLGMNAESVLVPQFKGVETSVFTYTKTGSTIDSEIDAITGATITTEAIVKAVNGAISVVLEDMMKGGE